jgi:hypothetical protein
MRCRAIAIPALGERLMHAQHLSSYNTTSTGRHGWWRLPWRGAILAALGLALATAHPAQAKTFRCPAGDVACLIAAINAANATAEPDLIQLAAGTYTLTAAAEVPSEGPRGLPSVSSPLVIIGAGAQATILERASGTPGFGLVHVAEAGRLTLTHLTLRGGSARTSGGAVLNEGWLTMAQAIVDDNNAIFGGGIANLDSGHLVLRLTTLARNAAFLGSGGGLANAGVATIQRSTIWGNGAESSGGGVGNFQGTLLISNSTIAENGTFLIGFGTGGGISGGGTLINSTVTGNTATSAYGGISGVAILHNTIVAGNVTFNRPDRPPDCREVISEGHNLIGNPLGCQVTLQPTDLTGEPGLGAFTDDGEPGHGHVLLLPGSPAIDAGDDAVCPRRDQLGQRRVGDCDIGAIEFQGDDPAIARLSD